MNNWRLLLLAVVAVLQPIGSFTESNLIDGRQECCRSNSANQDTNLYGTYQKTIPEERRLSTRQDYRKEQRHEALNDPITRLRERAERSISFERAVRVSGVSRFARDHERRQRTSIDAKESRQIQNEQNRRTREIFSGDSGDSSNQHERNVFDSRRIRITRDDNRIGRSSNVRVYTNLIDSEDHRRISTNRETMVAFGQKTDELARDAIHRDSKIIAVRAVDKSNPDNNRGRRSLDRRVRDDADGKESRKLKQINGKTELVGERMQREQNKEFRNREYADRARRISANHRRDSRETFERVDQPKRETRKHHNNERIDEHRQDLDESRLSRESSSYLSELRLSTSTDRREVLARESRNINGNDRLERIQRSKERREPSTDLSKASRDLTERRQVSQVSRKLEATSRDMRLVRPLTRSLDRISVLRLPQNEHNSRDSERNVRDERAVRYRKDVSKIDMLDERREHRDANQIVRDRTFSTLPDLRNSGRRHESRRSVSFSRLSLNSHRGRESYVDGDSLSNERFDKNHREREDRRGSQDRFLDRMTRNTGRRNNRESSIFVSTYASDRVATDESIFRNSKDIRSERFNARREVRDENRESRDRTLFMQGLSREASESQRTHDTQRMSRNAQTNIQRSHEDNRSEKREREEIRESHDITSETRSRERNQESRREIRNIFQKARDSRDNIRNEMNSNRVDLRMGERFEIRREQDKNRSSKGQVQSRNILAARSVERRQIRDILAERSVERKSRELTSRVAKVNKPLQRLSRSRDYRTYEREIGNSRGLSDVESRRESSITERKVYSKRHNLAMERMDNTTPRESRDVRIAATLRSTSLVRDVRTDTRRDAIDTRSRNFESMMQMVNSVEEASDNENIINWQVVFYTLQGAYLCGLLMQVLTEKPTKEKSRNLKWWAYPKNIVKVD